MELDHVFIFTQEPEKAAEALQQFGLTEGAPNTHPGQGTACRRFFFENAYLELVWVSNEVEVKSKAVAKTLLWERSQYQQTHYCPFGLCMRPPASEKPQPALLFEDGWKYTPPYLPEGAFINIVYNAAFPAEPLLFEIPHLNRMDKGQPNHPVQPLQHLWGFKEITKVVLFLPASLEHLSVAMQKVINKDRVAVVPANDFAITLEMDHCPKGASQHFHPLLPLTIRW